MGPEDDHRLDPAALAGLREIGGDAFVEELVDTFLTDAPTLLEALRTQDAKEVRRAAHTLKSNGATFGAGALADLCGQLEQQAKEGDLAGAPELAGRIEAEYELVAQALRPD
jgi:HPt (histidine-containing phosphotransfer) domain-containing protein